MHHSTSGAVLRNPASRRVVMTGIFFVFSFLLCCSLLTCSYFLLALQTWSQPQAPFAQLINSTALSVAFAIRFPKNRDLICKKTFLQNAISCLSYKKTALFQKQFRPREYPGFFLCTNKPTFPANSLQNTSANLQNVDALNAL